MKDISIGTAFFDLGAWSSPFLGGTYFVLFTDLCARHNTYHLGLKETNLYEGTLHSLQLDSPTRSFIIESSPSELLAKYKYYQSRIVYRSAI